MARNKGAGSTQGPSDEGSTAASEFPILIAGKSDLTAAAVKRVPTVNADGSVNVTVVSGGGGGGGGAVTVADGADVALGAIADAAVTGNNPGTVNAHLRGLATALPLPTGAATDRTTAAAPGSVELSDGAAFYTAAKTGQLPAALVTNRVDVNLGAAPATVTVQGGAAVGAAVVGNPNLIGVVDGSGNMQNVKQAGSTAATITAVGLPAQALYLFNASNDFRPTSNCNITDAQGGAQHMAAGQWLNNGSTWDRFRNNAEATLLASAARTTTQTSADITTFNAQAIIVVLDMTAVGAGPSVTLSIDAKDTLSGKYYNLLTGIAVSTAITTVYRVDPALIAAANLIAQLRLGRTIRIVVTANNANSGTYSVGYVLVSPGG